MFLTASILFVQIIHKLLKNDLIHRINHLCLPAGHIKSAECRQTGLCCIVGTVYIFYNILLIFIDVWDVNIQEKSSLLTEKSCDLRVNIQKHITF